MNNKWISVSYINKPSFVSDWIKKNVDDGDDRNMKRNNSLKFSKEYYIFS
jgi:hypothetical protein